MIEYVHRRLVAWGEWSMVRQDGGSGISLSQYHYTEEMPGGGHDALSAILANEPCLEMEMGVAWLTKSEPKMGAVVCDLYRDYPHTKAEQLAHMNFCGLRMFWYRIDKAHVLLLDWLNGRAIGEFDEEMREAWGEYIAKMPKIVPAEPMPETIS